MAYAFLRRISCCFVRPSPACRTPVRSMARKNVELLLFLEKRSPVLDAIFSAEKGAVMVHILRFVKTIS